MHFNYNETYEVDGQILTDYSDKKSPKHQIGIWISLNPAHPMQIDAMWHYQASDKWIHDPIKHHTRIRLAWELTKTWSVAVIVQNLWEANKTEFYSKFPAILIHNAEPTKTPLSIFIQTSFQWH